MRCDTSTGLNGRLIDYHEEGQYNNGVSYGVAIVERDSYPFNGRPFSVHSITQDGGYSAATNGKYDLTYEEARKLYDQRVQETQTA